MVRSLMLLFLLAGLLPAQVTLSPSKSKVLVQGPVVYQLEIWGTGHPIDAWWANLTESYLKVNFRNGQYPCWVVVSPVAPVPGKAFGDQLWYLQPNSGWVIDLRSDTKGLVERINGQVGLAIPTKFLTGVKLGAQAVILDPAGWRVSQCAILK